MTVRRYRGVEEMPGDRRLTPLAPENLRIALELSELARRLGGWTLPAGVRRYRSAEEAAKARRERENSEIRARRATRRL